MEHLNNSRSSVDAECNEIPSGDNLQRSRCSMYLKNESVDSQESLSSV